jgi:3-deoxy-D-manno-octulosonate 8-phosphate phosphatase (KDO 8-P phosphatase)
MSDALMTPELRRRAEQLEWLLLDVDGVLTDGTIFMDGRGESVKAFNVKDGLGIKVAQRVGLKVGILSARSSNGLERRASQLGIDVLISGVDDKSAAFDRFLEQQATSPGRVAYIGDDLNDLAVLGRCGLSFAPSDAVLEVRALVHVVLPSPGGRGAVRAMVENVLEARGDWKAVLSSFSLEQ